ncbi:hypothetical protein V1523DRAFT_416278 [Lipomyces doorenjongii]
MSLTNPTAKPFSPRHRPPPIQLRHAQAPDQRDAAVSFAPTPAARASLLSNIRTRNENLAHPRTPYPPGYSTPKKQQYTEAPYGVNNSSPSSSEEDLRDEAKEEERLDPRIYAALHAKQQELLATSKYIAQQQQRIQLAMMNAAQQQLQQQFQQQQQQQYYQDPDGNVWLMPPGDMYSHSGVYGNYVTPSQQSSPRTGSPSSITSMYGAEYAGVQTQELYSMGNGSTSSLGSNNGKAGRRKAHKKSSSLSSVQFGPHVQSGQAKKPVSPSPLSTKFDEYRVEVGTRGASPSGDMSANGNSNPYAPIRQPMIPITLEELKKSVNSKLNFWSVGVARLRTSTEGRNMRGKVIIDGTWEKNWVDEDLKKLWRIAEGGVNGILEVEKGVNELSMEL